jgi:hypothetical protein
MFLLSVLANASLCRPVFISSAFIHYEPYQTMHKAQAVPSFCGIRIGRFTFDTFSTFEV